MSRGNYKLISCLEEHTAKSRHCLQTAEEACAKVSKRCWHKSKHKSQGRLLKVTFLHRYSEATLPLWSDVGRPFWTLLNTYNWVIRDGYGLQCCTNVIVRAITSLLTAFNSVNLAEMDPKWFYVTWTLPLLLTELIRPSSCIRMICWEGGGASF